MTDAPLNVLARLTPELNVGALVTLFNLPVKRSNEVAFAA